MRTLIISGLCLLIICEIGRAQPDSLWAKQYGDREIGARTCAGLVALDDGNLIMYGSVRYHEWPYYVDCFAVCIDSAGNVLWEKGYGGQQGYGQAFSYGALMQSGNILLVGTLAGQYNGEQYGDTPYAILIDSSGNELWSNVWPNGWSFVGVTVTADGGFIATGISHWDMYIVRVDSDFNTLWERRAWREDFNNIAYHAVETTDGGFAIIGFCNQQAADEGDAILLKLDSEGNKDWGNFYSHGDYRDSFSGIILQSDGGFLLYGITQTGGNGTEDIWILRTDSTGGELWSQTYGGDRADFPSEAIMTSDSAYIIVGYSQSIKYINGRWIEAPFVMRVNQNRDQAWERAFKVYAANIKFSGVIATSDGGYAISGNDYNYFWLFKTGRDPNHPNEAPRTFDLASPEDSIRLNAEQEVNFTWSRPFDPDRDTLQYKIAFWFPCGYDSMVVRFSSTDTSFIYDQMDSLLFYLYDFTNKPDDFVDVIWWVEASDGEFTTPSLSRRTLSAAIPYGVPPPAAHPQTMFTLYPAYPNPFNSVVQIPFAVPYSAPMTVALYDLSGRRVALLVNEPQSAGFHTVNWSANDAPTGIYFVRMSAPDFSKTQRMVLIR